MQVLSHFSLILALLASSCLTTREVEKKEQNNQQSSELKEQLDFETAALALINEQKTDPADLWVKNLTVTTTMISKTPHGWVSFQLDPRADHIETLDCPYDDKTKEVMPTCRTSTKLVENYLLTGLKPGLYSIKVRACVAIAKSKTTANCSPYTSAIYQQNPNVEEEIAAKTAELDEINQKLIAMGQPLYKDMLVVQKNLPSCQDQQVNKLITKQIADKYVALGPAYIGAGLTNPNARIVIDESSNISVVFPANLEDKNQNNSDTKRSNSNPSLGNEEQLALGVIAIAGGLMLTKYLARSFISFQINYVWKRTEKLVKDNDKFKRFQDRFEKLQKWGGKGIVLGVVAGNLTLIGFAIADPQGTKKFLFGLTDGGPCTETAGALANIVSIGRQAEELQKEMQIKQNQLNLLLAPQGLK
mgnify:CR=1 FL=1